MRISHYLLFTVLASSPSVPAAAETLEEAWQVAVGNNYRLKAAQADTQSSEHQLEAAQGQQWPTLIVSGGYTQYSDSIVSNTNFSSQSVQTSSGPVLVDGGNVQFKTAQQGSAKTQAIVSAPLFTSGRINANIDAATAMLNAMQASENAMVMDIKMQVAESFIAVLRAEKLVQVARSHADNLDAHARNVKSLYEQGMESRNESLASEVEATNAQQELLQKNHQLDDAKMQYNALLARELSEPVVLATTLPKKPQGALETLSDTALQERSELASMAGRIDSYFQQAESVKAENLPQLNLNGGYVYQQNAYQLHQGMWMMGVDVQWRLFDATTGHRSEAFTKQAYVLKAQYDELANQVKLQVRQSWLAVEETQQRVAVTEKSVSQAEENKRIVVENYKEGLATSSEVLHAEELQVKSHANLDQARYDAALAILRLRRSVGVL